MTEKIITKTKTTTKTKKMSDYKKPEATKVIKSRVVMILDESGSMNSCATATINSFNEQVEQLQSEYAKDGLDTEVSLYKFNSEVKLVFDSISVDAVRKLTRKDYMPIRTTAMYDCVGTAIKSLASSDQDNCATLFIIISDGQENASTKYTSETLAEMIQEKQNTKRWTFTYMGSNQDLSKVSETLHIPHANFANINTCSDASYASTVTSTLNSGNSLYRSALISGQSSTNSFFENKDKDKK